MNVLVFLKILVNLVVGRHSVIQTEKYFQKTLTMRKKKISKITEWSKDLTQSFNRVLRDLALRYFI